MCLAVCFLLMAIIPIVRDHKLLGVHLQEENVTDTVPTVRYDSTDGSTIVNTSYIGRTIIGYGGPTPVEIVVKNDRIERIEALANQETPEFIGSVLNSDMLESLDGMTLSEAASTQIDGVSGATYTSNAIIKNIKSGINYLLYNSSELKAETKTETPGVAFYCSLLVILAASILPFVIKNKKYRLLQLVVNVAVLGFWGGTFLSYSLLVSVTGNGITQLLLVPAAIMLITAFVYPLFGRPDHYCNWICPYGSLQEIAGKLVKWKIRVSPEVASRLINFRKLLWFVLMWFLWTGLWYDWMGYEPFAAFFFGDASVAVLIIAGLFLVLSLFMSRPYCRFVCPTGCLFKFAEGRTN